MLHLQAQSMAQLLLSDTQGYPFSMHSFVLPFRLSVLLSGITLRLPPSARERSLLSPVF